ncbi:MAG: hypothetical protein WB812_10860, partial [Woeseiaceae bacterium]
PQSEIGYERAYDVQDSCGLLTCTRRVRPASFTHMEFDASRPETRHSQSIEILMGKGTPPDDGDFYDARDVVKSIYASA